MIRWTDSIRQSGALTIYAGALAGSWAQIFREALHDFNLLSSTHKLGVTITASKRSPDSQNGANLSVETADGGISASYGGATQTGNFDGGRLHGLTLLFYRQPENSLERARIYLPSRPKVNTPAGLRPAGAGVMKVIAVHELFHACGLENADHSSDDIFQGTPRVDAGDTAKGDRVLIGTGPKAMPPIYLSGGTAKNIKDLWSR
jgi:hypothetical protein